MHIKVNLAALKQRVLHLETAGKSLAVTVASGIALTAHDLLMKTENIEQLFTPAGWLRIKHNLIYGGLLSIFGLFIKSPVKDKQ
ncbi:MAG TPA: hypothetical protein VK638_17535 [Edaphobacter sp.]|nr:hypothetical protein [Edaphobacter sp.]